MIYCFPLPGQHCHKRAHPLRLRLPLVIGSLLVCAFMPEAMFGRGGTVGGFLTSLVSSHLGRAALPLTKACASTQPEKLVSLRYLRISVFAPLYPSVGRSATGKGQRAVAQCAAETIPSMHQRCSPGHGLVSLITSSPYMPPTGESV